MISRFGGISLIFSFSSLFFAFNFALSRAYQANAFSQIIVYFCLVLFVIISAFIFKAVSGGSFNLFLIYVYLLFTIISTFFSGVDIQSIFAILGIVLLVVIYMLFSTEKSEIAFNYLIGLLSFLSWLFLVFALSQIYNPDAYSYGKNQFRGHFDNPNAFVGYCGLFLLIHLGLLRRFGFFNAKSISHMMALVIYIIVIALIGSRGAIMAIIISIVLSNRMSIKTILYILVISVLFYVGYLIIKSGYMEYSLQRSVFEETGRVAIINEYLDLLAERGLFIGTGMSREHGRIRSELSYLDIIASSGMGGIIFIIFIFIQTKSAILLARRGVAIIASSIIIYIVSISLFEGYLAGVSSLLTVFFYISCGVIYNVKKSISPSRLLVKG